MSQPNYSNASDFNKAFEKKTPPASQDAEMMVLGLMLGGINDLNMACSILKEDDFFYSQNKIMFRVMLSFFERDMPVDNFLIIEELKRLKMLESIGGINYVISCSQFSGSGANTEDYAKLVLDKALLRRIIFLCSDLHQKAMKDPEMVEQLLEEAQKGFFEIGRTCIAKTAKHIRVIADGTGTEDGKGLLTIVEERQAYYMEHNKPMEMAGTATGFYDLDRMIENMGNSNLIILAARPAMGKTAFALNIAENVAINQKKAVGVFSLEMSSEQLVGRVLSSHSEINGSEIKRGSIDGDQYQKIYEAVQHISACDILIDDQPGISVAELRVRARRWKEAYNIDLLIVDYLQLLTGTGSRSSKENRQQEVSEISRMLKTVARELDIPVLCLSQLNRKSEERSTHVPIMSDLRESGAIEQDADVIMFLHRPEYYNNLNKPGMAECIVAKNRHGAIGTVDLSFRKELAKFGSLAPVSQVRQEAGL